MDEAQSTVLFNHTLSLLKIRQNRRSADYAKVARSIAHSRLGPAYLQAYTSDIVKLSIQRHSAVICCNIKPHLTIAGFSLDHSNIHEVLK